MAVLNRAQLVLLVFLTVIWGVNWPVMKLGVTGFPPLTFRALSLWIGLPLLAAILVARKVAFRIPRRDWPELLVLASTNMFVWHVCIVLAIRTLSSGRAAILGYTMPVFSAVIGALFFAGALAPRAWAGVAAAALGVVLLLWHEFTQLAGRPDGVVLALVAAATWALGTQLLRRTRITAPTLTISFWMMALTTAVITVAALLFETADWSAPPPATVAAILFNAVLVLAFAQVAWFMLARDLPPVASSLSVMLIPVLGVFSGAVWLGEQLHWQDWVAVGLMMVSIASVLLPARR